GRERLRRAQKCPWFGAMQGVENARQKVAHSFNALEKQGYIKVVQREFPGQGSYATFSLTRKGRESIREGRYLWL
ncbi:MAG: hypothetical protein QW795_06415, partial [Candidatus Bathyarchaeia archaeon]